MSAFPPEFEEVEYTPPSIESLAVGSAGGKKHKTNGHTTWDADHETPLICRPLAPLPISKIPPWPWAYGDT